MDNNPHNVQEGEHVILDETFNNASEVVIWKLSPSGMFSQVCCVNEIGRNMWQVMTYRLSKMRS